MTCSERSDKDRRPEAEAFALGRLKDFLPERYAHLSIEMLTP